MKVTLYTKEREPACGDPDCCGYYYTYGEGETVEVDEETFEKLEASVDDLVGYEELYPADFGIVTNVVDSFGYIRKGED